jgi:hypothetical protein
MKVDVSIGGIATSASRARALSLIREAVANREAGLAGERPPPRAVQDTNSNQNARGK